MSWPLLRPVLKAPRLSLLPCTECVAAIASCLADLAASAASAPSKLRVRLRHLCSEHSEQLQAPRIAMHAVQPKHSRLDAWAVYCRASS